MLKFILILPNEADPEIDHDSTLFLAGLNAEVLAAWRQAAITLKGQAIFSFMYFDAESDSCKYFGVRSLESYAPIIVSQDPQIDAKFISTPKAAESFKSMLKFMLSVVSGTAPRAIKSEPIPVPSSALPWTVLSVMKKVVDTMISNHDVATRHFEKAVGHNVLDIVKNQSQDVLLVVVVTGSDVCTQFLTTVEMLSLAVINEDRIRIAVIDGVLNDIPAAWGVLSYPAVLWFPALDKPYPHDTPKPRLTWDSTKSVTEMFQFLQKFSSFDQKSLRVVSQEAFYQILEFQPTISLEFELEAHERSLNTNRFVFEDPFADFLMGEIVFGGNRLQALFEIYLFGYSIFITGISIGLWYQLRQLRRTIAENKTNNVRNNTSNNNNNNNDSNTKQKKK